MAAANSPTCINEGRTGEEARDKLRKLLRQRRVVELRDLCYVVGTQSRMTVFRRLREVGYRTSYTHRGRFYTLQEIPDFDNWGLWFHGQVGFSRAGTLKQTVAVQVEQSSDGRTHAELSQLLHVRVHNTLLDLVRQGRVGREPYRGSFLYVSVDPGHAAQQVKRRQEVAATIAEALRVATDEEVVEILVEALRAAPELPAPLLVAKRLVARGLRLELRHVEQVYVEHGLVPGKKTAPPTSRPSRR